MLKRLAGFIVLVPLSFAGTVFSDGTFNLANYTNPFTIATTSNGGSISGVNTQCSSCGNPGSGLSTAVTMTIQGSNPNNAVLDIGLLNGSFVYTPSVQGGLSSIFTSDDNLTGALVFMFSTLNTFDGFTPLIEQDGNFYVASLDGTTSGDPNYETLSGTLSASNFNLLNTTTGTTSAGSHPNFFGDQMTFGLVVESGAIALPAFTQTIENDNLLFNLNTVPEPSTFVLFAAAIGALAACGAAFRRQPALAGLSKTPTSTQTESAAKSS